MSSSGTRSKKTITNNAQHAQDEQSDKAISTPPKHPYATRTATKSANPTTSKLRDHCSSSTGELSQISKHLKKKTRNSRPKISTSPPSSPCDLSNVSDYQCAGTSRNPTTKKITFQASLPGSSSRVSKDEHKGRDAAPKMTVTLKKNIVSASSQKSSQLSLIHSKKTKDLKAEDQSSTIPCSSSQTSQFLADQRTTKDSKLGNKSTSAKEPSQPSKDHRPKKTQNINGNIEKSEISTPSSKPSDVQHALRLLKCSELEKIVIDTRSPSKSIQSSKHQPDMKISKDSTPKHNENVTISLKKSNLVSESELADQKGKTKLVEETPKQLYKEPRLKYYITWDGLEEAEHSGWNCYLCAKDLACSSDEAYGDIPVLPEVAVLACGHAFHSECLSFHTSEEQYQYSREPKCLACTGFS